tara:strand:- start:1471 stop:4020 length:2550 start_codon:yes stop_codon:yes gene_type:complete
MNTSNSLSGLILNELRLLFYSPLTYLFQLVFITGITVSIFFISDFYNTDEVSTRLLNVFLPWLGMILVPALTMSLWGDDQDKRELEFIFSLPVSTFSVVIGKMLAVYLILLITLLLTFPFIITLYYLGNPDSGLIFTSYVGCALILLLFLSFSIFGSSLIREPTGSYTISISIIFSSIILGWDVFEGLLKNVFPDNLINQIVLFSPVTWLKYLSSGRINLQSIYFFISFSSFFIFCTIWNLKLKRNGKNIFSNNPHTWFKFISLLMAIIISFGLSNRFSGYIDLTENKIFTLNEESIKIINRLPKNTTINFYWSETESSIPVEISSYGTRIKYFLKTISENSSLKLILIDPKPDSDHELQAMMNGISRIPMTSGDYFYLGMTVSHLDKTARIPYFDLRRNQLLEYDIILLLKGLGIKKVPKVGIISPFLPSSSIYKAPEGLTVLSELKKAYDVAIIPYFKNTLPEDIDTLIVIGANILQEEMLFKIDQLVMNGKSIVVLLDSFYRLKPSNNTTNINPSKEINDISDLLYQYGIEFIGETVHGDLNLSSPVSDNNQNSLSYPYWMRVRSSGFALGNPITASLNELLIIEPGKLVSVNNSNFEKLIFTTRESGSKPREDFLIKSPHQLAIEFKPEDAETILAAMTTGPYKSAFKEPINNISNTKHKKTTEGNSRVFVIADSDWIFDPFSLQKQIVGEEIITRPLNDNLNFFLNIIEYASGDDSLMNIRSKGNTQRSFVRVADLFKEVEDQIRIKELKISQEVSKLELKLINLTPKHNDLNYKELPQELKIELKNIGDQLLESRKKLRKIRYKIREEVEQLGANITLMNLLAGPLILLLIFSYSRYYRKYKK